MAIASGTWGTCPWAISDSGQLVISAGTVGETYENAFKNYADKITSVVFQSTVVIPRESYSGNWLFRKYTNLVSADLSGLDTTLAGDFGAFFEGCSKLDTVTFGPKCTFANATNLNNFFYNCSALTTLDLSPFAPPKTCSMACFFADCELLTTVKFGAAFNMPSNGAYTMGLDVSYWGFNLVPQVLFEGPFSALNNTSGITVMSDDDFAALTPAQRAGTWTRNVPFQCTISAIRTTSGAASEDGQDITVAAEYAATDTATNRTLTVYAKKSSDTNWPTAPSGTNSSSDASGKISVTVANVGDSAYDVKAIYTDGTHTIYAFPSVQANIRLVDIDRNGNVGVLGALSAKSIASPNGFYSNDHSSPIGTVKSNSKSVKLIGTDIDTPTAGASVTLDAGTWVVIGTWTMPSVSSSGTRIVECGIMSGDAKVNFHREVQGTRNYMRMQCSTVLSLTASTAVAVCGSTNVANTGPGWTQVLTVRIA